MTTQIVRTFNPDGVGANNFTTLAAAIAYTRSINWVANDQNLTMITYRDVVWPGEVDLLPVDDTRRVKWVPAAGLGANDINRGVFNTGSGLTITLPRKEYSLRMRPGTDFENMNIVIGSTGRGDIVLFDTHNDSNTYDCNFRYCRVIDQTPEPGAMMRVGNGYSVVSFTDSLIVTEKAGVMLSDGGRPTRIERCTLVARGAGLGTATVLSSDYGGPVVKDSVFIGFGGSILVNAVAVNCYSNTSPASGTTSGITVNSTTGALVVNESNDFRPKAGGGLIGKASSSAQSTNDILGNNRGSSADIGAWQMSPASPLPRGTIDSVSQLNGRVTIKGTAGSGTETVKASLLPTATPYNNGQAVVDINAPLTAGAFEITLDARVGEYVCKVVLGNDGGTTTLMSAVINVPGATATVTSQVLDGSTLILIGTTTGNPVSGLLVMPIAPSDSYGATEQSAPLTLTQGAFEVRLPLPPGYFGKGRLTVTASNGTSLPQGDITAVTIHGFSGNPEASASNAAPVADTTPPSMVGSIAVTSVSSTGFTLSWQPASDNNGISGYEYSINNGVSYTLASNVLTATVTGLAPSTNYSIKVRAIDTSNNKSTPVSTGITTNAAPVASAPVMAGELVVSLLVTTAFSLSWQAASGNVAGYEYSLNGGSTYTQVGNVLTTAISLLVPATTYDVRVRAYDSTGLKSEALVTEVTTEASSNVSFKPSVSRTVVVSSSSRTFTGGKYWSFSDPKKPRGFKDPDSTLDITFDWAEWLADMGSPRIVDVVFVLSGVENSGSFAAGTKTTVFVTGGTDGEAAVTCRVTTSSNPPRIDDRTIYLDVESQ